eukprot:8710925-Heterocapsa_arctica.AAC.1
MPYRGAPVGRSGTPALPRRSLWPSTRRTQGGCACGPAPPVCPGSREGHEAYRSLRPLDTARACRPPS